MGVKGILSPPQVLVPSMLVGMCRHRGTFGVLHVETCAMLETFVAVRENGNTLAVTTRILVVASERYIPAQDIDKEDGQHAVRRKWPCRQFLCHGRWMLLSLCPAPCVSL